MFLNPNLYILKSKSTGFYFSQRDKLFLNRMVGIELSCKNIFSDTKGIDMRSNKDCARTVH